QRVTLRGRQRQQIGEESQVLTRWRGARQQGFELPQPRLRWVVAYEPRRAAELVDKRIERAVLVIRRAEIAQAKIRLGVKPPLEGCGDARLPDAGLARNQHHLTFSHFRPCPAA